MTSHTDWDGRYLRLAQHVATWSKDPSTKCGCAITKNNRVVSLGFNGPPSGVNDADFVSPRETKIACTIHSELNAILTSNINDLNGCTIYISAPPCSNCAAVIVQKKITKVVIPKIEDFEFTKRWNFHLSLEMFRQAGVDLVELDVDMEEKSL